MKKICLILIVYIIMSVLVFIPDSREPQHVVYDIVSPIEETENVSDTLSKNKKKFITYMPLPEKGVFYKEVFYAPKNLTGVEIWMSSNDAVEQEYNIIFYNQEGEAIYSQSFTSGDIVEDNFTRIVFEDYTLSEGYWYSFTIVPTDYNMSTLLLGTVPNVSYWIIGLYVGEVLVEGTTLCFNLIYDYQQWGFINWMVLTIAMVMVLLWKNI